MRLLGFALISMLVMSSCLAINVQSFTVEMHEQEHQHLDQNKDVNAGYPKNSIENHHYIPRQDFNYGSDGGNGGGSGVEAWAVSSSFSGLFCSTRKGQKRVQDMRLLVLALALMVVAGSCLAAGNRKALAFESHEPEKLRDLIKDDFSKHPDSSNDRENGHHEIPLGKFSPPSG
ncbi:conserved hypothetical protein [Ricinus communis]|uniref:Uncharacterized protein n=1 Tax=Ricinus communis TaxID=3988 RepID=B9STV1_RICCO|nr:conserved hypothetical protein [Ricinus communis]